MLRSVRSAALAGLLSSSAWASTWVVDDNGGAGVDFTTISAAIAAAQPGDLVLVRPGVYAGFTLTKGLTILGSAGASVHGLAQLSGIPAGGPRAVLAELACAAVDVSGSGAPVILDDLTVAGPAAFIPVGTSALVSVQGSSDVRLHRVNAGAAYLLERIAMQVSASRVEITESAIVGGNGIDGDGALTNGTNGALGLICGSPSVVHLARTNVYGGSGGSGTGFDFGCCHGGSGAVAIVAGSSTMLVLSGPGFIVQGGSGGLGDACPQDGQPANGMTIGAGGEAHISGVVVHGGHTALDCGSLEATPIVGSYVVDVPVAPTLGMSADPFAGQNLVFTVTGAVGDAVRLRLGRQPVVVDLPDTLEDRLTNPLRTYDLGNIPASGSLQYTFHLPATLAQGYLLVAQVSAISTAGVSRLTTSVPIVLR